ncbi:MAG: hypothetical protein ACKVQW_16670 [Pyrinomonadaceae bacterium]
MMIFLFLHALIDGPTALLLLLFFLGSVVLVLRGVFIHATGRSTTRVLLNSLYVQTAIFSAVLILGLLSAGDGILGDPADAVRVYPGVPFGFFAGLPLFFILDPFELPPGLISIGLMALMNYWGILAVVYFFSKK